MHPRSPVLMTYRKKSWTRAAWFLKCISPSRIIPLQARSSGQGIFSADLNRLRRQEVFTRENLLLAHQRKITRQAEEKLKALTLQRNTALFLGLYCRQSDLIIRNLNKQSSGTVGPRASTLPSFI
jgi:hypothetical protein